MYSTIPQMLLEKTELNPALFIQYSKDKEGVFQPITYVEFTDDVLNFGAGLLSLGAVSGEHVGLISDNRREWFVCSVGIMSAGCCDIPRGSEATVKDLSYILSFAECKIVVVESNYSFKKIVECRDQLKDLQSVIVIDDKGVDKKSIDVNVYSFEDVLGFGRDYRMANPEKIEQIIQTGKSDDTATIIFTSGTTGVPKGVELTHKNFLCQVDGIRDVLGLKPGDRTLCVLPVWHVYEREMEYYYMANQISLCYSKPVPSMIIADLKKIKPHFMACVPRIWDALHKQMEKNAVGKSASRKVLFKLCTGATSVHRRFHDRIFGRNQQFKKPLWIFKILNKALYVPCLFLLPFKALGEAMFFHKSREMMGGSFRLGMSGGGGIAPKLDRFFNSIGIKLVEGYGLTETAPVISIRNYKKNVMGTIGQAMPYCQAKVLDRNGNECAPGQKGVLYVKGDNVMKCYYRQPDLTAEALKDGWFNTGDLVVMTYRGDIIVKGRAKDTIVLRSGENVEPLPLEGKLVESPYIAQAVVVGQDQNCLGALIIPRKDNLTAWAQEQHINSDNFSAFLKNESVKNLIFSEMENLITTKNGFKPFEKIGKFAFIEKPFEIGVELTAKGTVQRFKVQELYARQISLMFTDSILAQGLGTLTGNIGSVAGNLLNKIPGKNKKNK